MAARPVTDEWSGKQLRGFDYVKLCVRDLNAEMSPELAAQPYDSSHSYGKTYLEHRQALELSQDTNAKAEALARSLGLGFMLTICNPGALGVLNRVRVDAIKIASRDLANVPLLKAVAGRRERVIISTGMDDFGRISQAINILDSRRPRAVDILHCTSQYPADYNNLRMRRIEWLKCFYPAHKIGFSDHSVGVMAAPLAVGLGARIIEKHITLDRNDRGTDHAGSLGPDGCLRMLRDIRNAELAMDGNYSAICIEPTKRRIGRSLAAADFIPAGRVLTEDLLRMVSPGGGLQWEDAESLVGMTTCSDIPENTLLTKEHFTYPAE